MIGKRQAGAVILVLALVGPACGAESAEDAVRDVFAGLSQGKAEVVWDARPASYQKDLSFLVHTFATKMDPAAWNKAFEVTKKLVNILETKKQRILDNPQWAMMGAGVEKLEAGYGPFVEMLSLVVNSELSDLDKVTDLDLHRFSAGTVSKIWKKVMAIQEASDADGPGLDELLQGAKVTQVDQDQGVATVSIEMA
jgi:hypothetical protein